MQNISKEMYFYSGNERHDQREFVWTMHKVQCHEISNIEKIVLVTKNTHNKIEFYNLGTITDLKSLAFTTSL